MFTRQLVDCTSSERLEVVKNELGLRVCYHIIRKDSGLCRILYGTREEAMAALGKPLLKQVATKAAA